MAIKSSLCLLALALLPAGFAACSLATSGIGVAAASSGMGGGASSSEDCKDSVPCLDVPEGWTLVRAKAGVDPSQPPGTCANGATGTLYFRDPAGAPTCGTCTCDPPAGTKCTAPELTCHFDSNDCSGKTSFVLRPDQEGCLDLNSSTVPPIDVPGGLHIEGSCVITDRGKPPEDVCGAPGGQIIPSPKWTEAIRACAIGSGCPDGEPCAPEDPGTDGDLCITRQGNDPCPSGWQTSEIAAFAGGDDTRSCSGCSCSVPSCSGGKHVVFDLFNCVNFNPSVSVDTAACKATLGLFDDDTASVNTIFDTPDAAVCSVSIPLGAVTPTGPQQICCR